MPFPKITESAVLGKVKACVCVAVLAEFVDVNDMLDGVPNVTVPVVVIGLKSIPLPAITLVTVPLPLPDWYSGIVKILVVGFHVAGPLLPVVSNEIVFNSCGKTVALSNLTVPVVVIVPPNVP